MKRLLLLFVFVLSAALLGAQIFDSTQLGYNSVSNAVIKSLDTSLEITNYLNFTDNGGDDFGFLNLGNQGDIRRRLMPFLNSSVSPQLGIDGYFKNYIASSSVASYNVLAATGGIRLFTGYEKGQLFGLFFTINPSSRLNFYIDFQRINSSGPYFRQENKNDQLKYSTTFQSKGGRYRLFTALSWNSATNGEYGGIADPLAFEDNTLDNRQLVPVNLLASGTKIRSADILFKHQLDILKLDSANDVSLFHEFRLIDQFVVFQSQDSLFAANALFEEQGVRDSVRFSSITNHVGLKWNLRRHELKAGVELLSYRYGNSYLKQSDNIVGFNGAYAANFNNFFYAFEFTTYFNEAWAGSNTINGRLGINLSNDWRLITEAKNDNVAPNLFHQKYISNNFVWNNSFSNSQHTMLKAKLEYRKNWLAVGNTTTQNYVYFDEFARPNQYSGIINILFVEGSANLKLLPSFYLDNQVRYQFVDEKQFIPVPNWILRHVLYFQQDVFRKAARIQTGIEFRYFSGFASERYMPATTVMYLQGQENQQIIGDFPYFNYFFNFKIKEFTFFLRLENITQGLFEYNYYAAPGYPMPDFNVRVGATWRFFN